MTEDRYLTAVEAASKLNISVRRLMALIRAGVIKGCIPPLEPESVRIPPGSIENLGKVVEEPGTGAEVDDEELAELKKGKALNDAKRTMQDSANALELSRRQYANFAEFDKAREGWEKTKTEIETNLGKLQAESVEKAEALAKWEKANDEIQITLANREKSVEAGEQELAVKVEKEKSLSLSRQNRWNDAEKAQQKKHEDEDAKRQLRTLKILGDVDALAGAVYNASSFEINNQLQEKLIALLAPILDYVNLRPTVDSLNRYVPMSDRNLPGIEIKETGRDVLSIPSDGELPANIRACFKVTVKVFNFLNKEPQLGRDFCTRMKATAQKLQELVRGKSDDELIASKERILVFFNAFHKNMTLLAGNYQEAKGDFQAESDWLHSQAIFLEKKIGVGVYQDGFLPLAHPKRKNNR